MARYGLFERALAARRQVLELEEATSPDDAVKGWNRLEMGEIYRLTGDLRTAREWYDAALSHFNAAQSGDGIAQVRRALADLALAKGDYGQALEGFGACLARFDGREWWQAAYATSGLGRAYLAMGEIAKALEAFLDTLHGNRTNPGLALLSIVGLAEVLEVQGELMAAIRLAAFAHSQPAIWYESRNRAGAVIARVSEQLPAAQLAEAYAAASRLTLAEVLAQWAPVQSDPGTLA
jgi:tetratricopeptide (TPR) repeat protein